jgi:hypothetical protein
VGPYLNSTELSNWIGSTDYCVDGLRDRFFISPSQLFNKLTRFSRFYGRFAIDLTFIGNQQWSVFRVSKGASHLGAGLSISTTNTITSPY